VRILDATDYPRPKTEAVKMGYAPGASGMHVGHGLSLLSERVGAGSWTLPLEIGWIPPRSHPIAYGVAQLDEFVKRHPWPEKREPAVDAQYTVIPFFNPVHHVIEYKAGGEPPYKRPLWLIFAPASVEMESPTPLEAQAMYEERFSVEHGIRFMKGDLGLTCGQFNSTEAEGRVQVLVEMAATAFWFLWALRAMAETEGEKLPGWWRSGKLTPGAVRRLSAGFLLSLGWSRPEPKTRGKSVGRAAGTNFEPRERFKASRSAAQ
jgi:hypothetical protein